MGVTPTSSPTDVLTLEMAVLVVGLETGTSTSTVKQEWGCGHSVWRVNGDSLYSACPICHADRVLARG
jgi:hypothetical protein